MTSQAARGEGGASLGPPQPPVGGCHSGRHEGGRPEEARLEPCQRGMVAQEELDDQGQHVPRRRGLAPSPPTHTPPCSPTSLNPAPPVSGSWARDTLYRALRSLQGSPGSVVAARRVFGEKRITVFNHWSSLANGREMGGKPALSKRWKTQSWVKRRSNDAHKLNSLKTKQPRYFVFSSSPLLVFRTLVASRGRLQCHPGPGSHPERQPKGWRCFVSVPRVI